MRNKNPLTMSTCFNPKKALLLIVAKKSGYKYPVVEQVFDAIIHTLISLLAKGYTINIPQFGSFTFHIHKLKANGKKSPVLPGTIHARNLERRIARQSKRWHMVFVRHTRLLHLTEKLLSKNYLFKPKRLTLLSKAP